MMWCYDQVHGVFLFAIRTPKIAYKHRLSRQPRSKHLLVTYLRNIIMIFQTNKKMRWVYGTIIPEADISQLTLSIISFNNGFVCSNSTSVPSSSVPSSSVSSSSVSSSKFLVDESSPSLSLSLLSLSLVFSSDEDSLSLLLSPSLLLSSLLPAFSGAGVIGSLLSVDVLFCAVP
jgi:hypothetical protein